MRPLLNLPRLSRWLLPLLSALGFALLPAGASAGQASPFTAAQIKQLKAWGIQPIAPSYTAGLSGVVKLDARTHKYDITYAGSGLSYIWEGGPSSVEVQEQSTKKDNNVIASVSHTISKWFGHAQAAAPAESPTPSSGLAPVYEGDPSHNDVVAPSPLLGPAHFTRADCGDQQGAIGVSSKGVGDARYSLKTCGGSVDDLIRIYRSAAAVK